MAELFALAFTMAEAKCRGQGNLWEDPGQGQPWVGPPPITSAQAGISAVARQKESAHPPVAAAFNMDEELLMLEQQTKTIL